MQRASGPQLFNKLESRLKSATWSFKLPSQWNERTIKVLRKKVPPTHVAKQQTGDG